jgi:hypothetical protein
MRYAAVYIPESVICEVRSGSAPPGYVPQDCAWVDVSARPEGDADLIGAQWINGDVVLRPIAMNLEPKFDLGKTMAEILGNQ